MTTSSRRDMAPQRIAGPAELVQAIPYLLGFHPHRSLVLVGLDDGRLIVTARLDLADAVDPSTLAQTLQALRRGGSRDIVAAVYDDVVVEPGDPVLPGADAARELARLCDEAGCPAIDVLLVAAGRWWSLLCEQPDCCPAEGGKLPAAPSAFAAAATYEGIVALDDRAALARLLEPLSAAERAGLAPAIEAAEHAAVAAVLGGQRQRHQRAVKRAIFTAARTAGAGALSGEDVARFVVALGETEIRDAVWMAIDDGRIDGRELWRDLARRAPAPYDAPPLFLHGWASWRAGQGALANVAAERATLSDPGYSAADLLSAALSHGIDPRRFPKLRLPRSA